MRGQSTLGAAAFGLALIFFVVIQAVPPLLGRFLLAALLFVFALFAPQP